MARRKKPHHNLKPQVNPITYIILGVTFLILTLAIILSVDTKNQKLTKRYDLGKNNYNVVTLKQVSKDINKDKNTFVVFLVESKMEKSPKLFLDETLLMYNAKEGYDANVLRSKVKKIQVVFIATKDQEAFGQFINDHEVKYTNSPTMIMYFEKGELVAESNLSADHGVHPEGDIDKRNMQENLKQFLRNLEDGLSLE